ncbi:MAG: hypothetical protein K5900_13605, partial [Butyrivibrio sp.]|nr:hypothetical protein [Butyrivibrio sp.]
MVIIQYWNGSICFIGKVDLLNSEICKPANIKSCDFTFLGFSFLHFRKSSNPRSMFHRSAMQTSGTAVPKLPDKARTVEVEQPSSENESSLISEYQNTDDFNEQEAPVLEPTAEINSSSFADHKIQILDMVFKLDGSMLLKDVAKVLADSKFDIQYDLSEDSILTNNDRQFEITYQGKKIFTIFGSSISTDEDYIKAYDAIFANIQFTDDGKQFVFLPGGIGLKDGKKIDDVKQIIEEQNIPKLEDNGKFGYEQGTLLGQIVFEIRIPQSMPTDSGYYSYVTYTIGIDNTDSQVNNLTAGVSWIEPNSSDTVPYIKAYFDDAHRINSIDEVNESVWMDYALRTAEEILNNSYDTNYIVGSKEFDNLTPYRIDEFLDRYDLYTVMYTTLFSNGKTGYVTLEITENDGICSNGTTCYSAVSKISCSESQYYNIEKTEKTIFFENPSTVYKSQELEGKTDIVSSSKIDDGIYETLPVWVSEMDIEDNIFSISAESIWPLGSDRSNAIKDTISIPISEGIGFGAIDITSSFEDN